MVGLSRAAHAGGDAPGVAEVIPDRFEYRTGVTYVGSTVDDLLEAGAGVCQDFAHLALLLLRRNGIAARYVSGYLFAPAGGDEAADSAEVDTHAWVEALSPRPTAASPSGSRPTRRTAARRRAPRQDRPRPLLRRRAADQGRVPRRGGAELDASVRMTRTDTSPRTAPAT